MCRQKLGCVHHGQALAPKRVLQRAQLLFRNTLVADRVPSSTTHKLKMAAAPVLYQETRISLGPSSSSEILHIQTTPSKQPPTLAAGRKRPFDEISGLDEETYARKHLATEGSVFHRRKGRAPRSFVWRVLDDRKALEIQCVDLVRGGKDAKNNRQLTYRIEVESGIVRNGVAFADPDEADALEVFVVGADGQLYTFTLKRDLLTRETTPNEFDATTCFKIFASSALSFRHLYRLVAVSSLELLISLHDGGFIRLQREANNAGTRWNEKNFSEGGWSGTLRGLISLKRHQTVRYGELELETNGMTAMAKSPDGKFIWTVTLDHRLLAWSTSIGKGGPVLQMDLLNEEEQDGRKQKYVMGAEQGTVLQLITLTSLSRERPVAKMDVDEARKYCLVVHSPKDHQFKFYEVSSHWNSVEGDVPEIQDLQPRATLITPIDELMNSNIWHMEEFCVLPGASWADSQVWIRARSGTLCRVFTLNFGLLDEDGRTADVADAWAKGWTTVDEGLETAEALKTCEDYPGDLEVIANAAITPTERWLRFIFHPQRFSIASIEAALHTYRKGRGLSAATSSKGFSAAQTPLQERLIQAISAKIMLKRLPNEQPDYDKYQADVHAQWKTYYSLLSHLHSRRQESIGFSVDMEQALAWTVSADFVSPIRASSDFEKLALNDHLIHEDKLEIFDQGTVHAIFPNDEAVNLAILLSAARDFRAGLSASFRASFQHAAVDEAVTHTFMDWTASKNRVLHLYESQNFSAEVMDDDFSALEQAAEALDGLGNLSANTFLAVFEKMDEDGQVKGKDLHSHLRRYGERFTVAVAQETLRRDRGVLLDMLALITFIYGDLDQADLHEDLVGQIGELYEAVIARLKHSEFLSWLAGNVMQVSSESTEDSGSVGSMTLLEAIFISGWPRICKAQSTESMSQLLTDWSKRWTYGLDLSAAWDGLTGHVLAVLIKQQCYDLATGMLKFLNQSEESPSWLRYVEGRLQIALGEYKLASLKLQAAADGLSDRRMKIDSMDPTQLLSAEARNYFAAGLSRYFQHVSYLFEQVKVWSYTADFAQLAIDHLNTNEQDMRRSLADIDRRKGNTDSPASSRIDDTMEEIRILKLTGDADDLRSRLFNALVQTGRWEAAFSALSLMKNSPPKRAGLKQLIELAAKSSAVETLLSLPFSNTNLLDDADSILSDLATKSLTTGAGGVPYHRILYAFRVGHSDFRGAAQILYQYLQHLRVRYAKHWIQDPEDEGLVQVYVLLINAMVCCGEGEGWLLAEGQKGGKRRLVRLEDVRREYVAELDRRSEVLMGRFPLVGGADVDEAEGMEVDVF